MLVGISWEASRGPLLGGGRFGASWGLFGWVFEDSDSWEEAGRRMKQRLDSARRLHVIADWSSVVAKRKKHLLSRLMSHHAPSLPKLAHEWSPIACAALNNSRPHRARGRPRRRWFDAVQL